MDTTTPDLYYVNHTYDDTHLSPDPDDPINMPAFVGCWIAFIALTCLLNAVVIACVICRHVRGRSSKAGRPKVLVIAACCVLQVVCALGPSAVFVHNSIDSRKKTAETFTCGGMLTLELTAFLLPSVVTLLVAVVVVVEGLRIQRFVALTPGVQLAAAALLVALSGVYGVVVVVPVFFLLFREDASQPCLEHSPFLDIDFVTYRDITISDFIVPHSLVFVSCALLLLAYFTRRHGAATAYVHYSSAAPSGTRCEATSTSTTTTTTNSMFTAPSQSGDPSLSIVPIHPSWAAQQTGTPTLAADVRFPWHVLLAAAVSFVFGFVFFLHFHVYLHLPTSQYIRLNVAGVLLFALKDVFLPCCWLLDGHVWAGRTCWRDPHSSEVTGRGPQDGEEWEEGENFASLDGDKLL